MKQTKQPLYWIYCTTQGVEFDRHRELHKQLKEKQKKQKNATYIDAHVQPYHMLHSQLTVSQTTLQ